MAEQLIEKDCVTPETLTRAIPGDSYEKPISVMHIITRMVKGGAQEDVLDLVVKIDNTRFKSVLVTGPSDGPEGSLIAKCIDQGAALRHVEPLTREVSPVSDLRALYALMKLMREMRPDIVHTHTSKAGIVGRIAARRTGVPVIIHSPHGHVFHGYYGKLKTGLFILLERWCARITDRLIMITENERTDHIDLKIAPEDRFQIIHSGVDFKSLIASAGQRGALRTQFGIPESAQLIGTLGRLVPIKGQIHLINAMPEILANFPDCHLVLVGSGPLLESLSARALELGIASHVHFTGYREDVGPCLSDMDLFILPSINEGMGRALVEAMALRVPSIASDVCGIRDLIKDRVSGILVPVSDSAAIARASLELLGNQELARSLADAGYRRVVPEYSVEQMIIAIERLYRDEMNRASRLTKLHRPGV